MYRSRVLLMRAGRSFSSESESKAKVAYARASLPFVPHYGAHQRKTDPIPESYPFTVLHHHKHPELLPPRHPGSMSNFAHHVLSSIDAVASLCTAQENRDRFLELTDAPSDEDNDGNLENRCIIDTSILGQSELGFMKVLTLYQDLNNPLFRQYPKFDVQDFLSGCGWALEKFHRTNDEFMAKLMNFDKANDINPGYDFLKAALEDPDSPEQTLTSMTTPQGVHYLNMNNSRRLVFDILEFGETNTENPINIRLNGTDWDSVIEVGKLYENKGDIGTGLRFLRKDSKIMNVALLSARVEEIYPPADTSEQIENGDSDPDAPLEDESLRPFREDCDFKAQVVTQLEVLYELQQSSINEDGKTVTAKNLFVGTFEACLNGDGDEDLEWRLASHRPAVEFGAA